MPPSQVFVIAANGRVQQDALSPTVFDAWLVDVPSAVVDAVTDFVAAQGLANGTDLQVLNAGGGQVFKVWPSLQAE